LLLLIVLQEPFIGFAAGTARLSGRGAAWCVDVTRPPSGGQGPLVILQMPHVEVARRFKPVFMHVDWQRPRQLKAALCVGEDAHDRFVTVWRGPHYGTLLLTFSTHPLSLFRHRCW
jgi:hypothetical protein